MENSQANLQIIEISNKIVQLESSLKQFKKIENEYQEFRKKLFDVMIENGIDKYVSNEGLRFTIVRGSPEKTEITIEFNKEKLKKEEPEIYKKYLEQVEKITKEKASYLRITLPENEQE